MKKKTADQKTADGLIKDMEKLIDTLNATKKDEKLKKTLETAVEKFRKERETMAS
jgi:hypothetical protein